MSRYEIQVKQGGHWYVADVLTSMLDAMRYCRENVSYSGGRVERVEIRSEDGVRAVYDRSWDGVSNWHALHAD